MIPFTDEQRRQLSNDIDDIIRFYDGALGRYDVLDTIKRLDEFGLHLSAGRYVVSDTMPRCSDPECQNVGTHIGVVFLNDAQGHIIGQFNTQPPILRCDDHLDYVPVVEAIPLEQWQQIAEHPAKQGVLLSRDKSNFVYINLTTNQAVNPNRPSIVNLPPKFPGKL